LTLVPPLFSRVRSLQTFNLNLVHLEHGLHHSSRLLRISAAVQHDLLVRIQS
jgi:hypothetical protein